MSPPKDKETHGVTVMCPKGKVCTVRATITSLVKKDVIVNPGNESEATLSEESAPHQVGQDAVEVFLREAGLTSLSLSPLPLPLRRLSSSDRRDILGKRWLSDDVIDLAQEVLQRQFPHLGGLYACGVAFTLPPLQPGAKSVFVQVVNRSAPQSLACMADYSRALGTHWLLLSSYGATLNGELVVYDSMYCRLGEAAAGAVSCSSGH